MEFLWVAVRLGAALAMLPQMGGPFAKIAATVAATFAIAPWIEAPSSTGPAAWAALSLREATVGLCIGLSASAALHGAQAAGRLLDYSLGASSREERVSFLYALLALTIFFSSGAHRTVLGALGESYVWMPIGFGPLPLEGIVTRAVTASAGLLSTAVLLAAPLVLVTILSDLTIALAARLLPSLHAALLLAPARALLLLFVLAGSVVTLQPALTRAIRDSARHTSDAMRGP